MKKKYTDKNRLDFLQMITRGYGNGWLLRESSSGRGMRLYETSMDGAMPDIRDAIDKELVKFENEESNDDKSCEKTGCNCGCKN